MKRGRYALVDLIPLLSRICPKQSYMLNKIVLATLPCYAAVLRYCHTAAATIILIEQNYLLIVTNKSGLMHHQDFQLMLALLLNEY